VSQLTGDRVELDLSVFLRILRRRWWALILIPILVAGSAYLASSGETPRYRSNAQVLLAPTGVASILNASGEASSNPARALADQISVIQGDQITKAVKSTLGFTPPPIAASASSTDDIINLSATSTNAKQSAAAVNGYANAYLKYLQSTGSTANAAAQAELQQQINAAQSELNSLDTAVAAQPTAAAMSQLLATQAAERSPIENQITSEDSQLSQLQAAAALDQSGAQLIHRATVPAVPYLPNPKRDSALGLAVGLMLALGLAFLLDYLDNRIRGKEDLERSSTPIPVVGMIPVQPEWRDTDLATVVSVDKPSSGSAEAYRKLRTSIQFLSLDRSMHTLQVTSPMTSEGKTTTVVNLAVALARAGQTVIVVDCDLRRPRVHQFLGVEPEPGFTSVLLGEIPLSGALHRVPAIDGLRCLSSGPVPLNPSELLSGRRAIELFEALKADSDFVLIDSPPVLPVSDATVIATRVDATLVVVKDNTTLRKHLTRSLELLHQIDAVVIGTVLNGVAKAEVGYDYQYGYGYYKSRAAVVMGTNGNESGKMGSATAWSHRRTKNPAKRPNTARLGTDGQVTAPTSVTTVEAVSDSDFPPTTSAATDGEAGS
jgi:polysaccharide biosynthesis transport protein